MLALSKKVLVVSSWAPPMVGGPQNLYNLFSQFTPDSYCILTRYETVQQREATGSKLAGKYFFCDASSTNFASPTKASSAQIKSVGCIQRFLGLAKRVPFVADNVYYAVYSLSTIANMVRMGIRIVREKGIECIFGISDVGPALIASYLISRFTGVPYAIYLFDIYIGNNFVAVNRLLAMIFERRIFDSASVVILTNEGTERLYRNRYGNDFKCAVVHNSIFLSDYESQRTPYSPSEPYRIVFTGNIYWPQERSLINLVKALDELHDLPIQLDLYVPNATSELREQIGSRHNVRLMAAPQSDMGRIQCNATLLFLPLSWHTRAPEIIATATPGKLSDYLASGRPILIHAPPYAYINKYAKENSFALVVEEEDVEKLKDGIKKLLFDLEYSQRLIENAKKTLYKNHDATLNAQKLTGIISSI